MKKLLNSLWNAPAGIADALWSNRYIVILVAMTIACLMIFYQPRVAHSTAASSESPPVCAEESLVLTSSDNDSAPLCYFWVPEGTPDFVKWQLSYVKIVYEDDEAMVIQVTFRKGGVHWTLGMIGIKPTKERELTLFGALYLVTAIKGADGDYLYPKFWVFNGPDTCPYEVDEDTLEKIIGLVIKGFQSPRG